LSHLDLSDELRALIPFKRRIELDRIPKAQWPADRKRSDMYRAFAYATPEAEAAWQEFYETEYGAVKVADFTPPALGKPVHLYRLDKAMVAQKTQELRAEKAAEMESARAGKIG
jgi:hypothetical protein